MSLRLAIPAGAICVALASCTPGTPPGPEPVSVPRISVADMCTAARADDRMGDLSQSQCTCFYGQARNTLDPDVGDRLIYALYTGKGQGDYLDNLPSERRAQVAAQMRAVVDKAPACGIEDFLP